jgi:hypothetical protein
MAAAWLRVDEVSTSLADTVCIVARVQSIQLSQRLLIVYDDNDEHRTSMSTLHVSFANVRSSFDVESNMISPGQCLQIYGQVIRHANGTVRIDAQLIRQLVNNFDINEYVKGLLLTRQYMANVQADDVHRQ